MITDSHRPQLKGIEFNVFFLFENKNTIRNEERKHTQRIFSRIESKTIIHTNTQFLYISK